MSRSRTVATGHPASSATGTTSHVRSCDARRRPADVRAPHVRDRDACPQGEAR
jgi:hypothetical protein